MGGEACNPRLSMAHACKLVPYRVTFVYMSCIVFITLLVASDDERLVGGKGITASPFVIAIQDSGIPGIPHILNAGIMVGILAISAEAVYLFSRIVRTMAHQNLISHWIAQVDCRGRPRRALLVTCTVGVMFTHINLSSGGKDALNWLVQITASSFFVNWIIVAFTSYRFHQCLKAQNDSLSNEVYARAI